VSDTELLAKLEPGRWGAGAMARRAEDADCRRKLRERRDGMYCGPVLRHPAELMLPAVDLGGRVWLGGKP
jgi:hypothetical protein